MTNFTFTDANALRNALAGETLDSIASLETVLCRVKKEQQQQKLTNRNLNVYLVQLNNRLVPPLAGLRSALVRVERLGFKFTELIANIRLWAESNIVTCRLLEFGVASTTSLSETEIRSLLAHAFFGSCLRFNDGTGRQFGELSFWRLYGHREPNECEERLACLLAYFAVANDCSATEMVQFERVRLPNVPDLENCRLRVSADSIVIHDKLMEEPMLGDDRPVFVDFANKRLHIHSVIPSCTQEEILFSCAPSLFPSILITETLDDDEIVVIRNVRRYVLYSGYLDSFKFESLNQNRDRRFDVVAIDACTSMHFARENNARDTGKFHLACVAAQSRPLSTGVWGCGVFGGDIVHKFVQQCLTATLSNTKLYFSASEQRARRLRDVLASINGREVGDVWRIVLRYTRNADASFADFLERQLALK